MNIVICDDQRKDLDHIAQLCQRYICEFGIDGEIVTTMEPGEVSAQNPQLLILDIEMPEVSGIDIKNSFTPENRPWIIFATSHDELFRDAFGPNVIGFLSKPVSWDDFRDVMDSAISNMELDKLIDFGDGLLVKTGEVVYIAVDGKYTEAVFEDGYKKQWLRKTMAAWEEELSELGFLRVNKSHLVNCKFIRDIEGFDAQLKNGEELKVSRRKKDECLQRLMAYKIKKSKYV